VHPHPLVAQEQVAQPQDEGFSPRCFHGLNRPL
jgi:hypothetical protein